MKFLLELGACYRSSKQTQDHVIRTRTHVRRSSKSAESAHQWRPALVAISEDGVVSDHEGKVQSQKMSSDKGRSKAKARSISYFDDPYYYRGSNVPVFLPAAFSATPFMF